MFSRNNNPRAGAPDQATTRNQTHAASNAQMVQNRADPATTRNQTANGLKNQSPSPAASREMARGNVASGNMAPMHNANPANNNRAGAREMATAVNPNKPSPMSPATDPAMAQRHRSNAVSNRHARTTEPSGAPEHGGNKNA